MSWPSGLVVICICTAIAAVSAQQPARKSIVELVDQYEAGEFNAAVRDAAAAYKSDLRVLIKDLTTVVPKIATESAAHQKRRLVIASFALEVVMEQRARLWSDSGHLLLEWACGQLKRSDPPLPAEREWHLAALGVISGASDGARLEFHLTHSERRFPEEPRFVLARAMAAEMRTWPEQNYLDLDVKNLEMVGPAFEKPARISELQPEAELRWGSTELRAYRAQQALVHFNKMGPTSDAYLLFLKHLFRARALETVGPPEAAIDAYRSAIAIASTAQSARLGLAGLLARENRRVEAATLIRETLAIPAELINDPWLSYGAGDQRFWPIHATELRRLIRQ